MVPLLGVHLHWLELTGLKFALCESVSEWWVNMKAQDITVHYSGLYKHCKSESS